jgi:hypothetical protein
VREQVDHLAGEILLAVFGIVVDSRGGIPPVDGLEGHGIALTAGP